MPKKRFATGRIKLKKGEYERSNGTFEYRWTENSVNRCVYAKTLLELRKKEDEIQKNYNDGIKTISKDITLNHYYRIWMSIKSGVRDSTLVTYQRLYLRYIENGLGETPIRNLSYSTIVKFYKGLIEEKGLGISSVDNLNVVLSMVLDVAVRDGLIRANPCNGTLKELRREYAHTVKEVKALTRSEQTLFEDFISRTGIFHCLEPIITVMLYTGMRVGEVGGLRWADVDFERNEINITHTLVYDGKPSRKGAEYQLNPPKTKTSERCIPISPRVKEALLNEKKRQEEIGIKCSVTINGYSDFVFLDDKGGLFHYKKLNHRLDRLSAAIDAEIKSQGMINGLIAFPHVHSHMLRHTFATRMREAGADIKATADIMGHTETALTLNVYTDATTEFKRKAINCLEQNNEILIAEVTSIPKNLPIFDTKIGSVEGS